MASTLMAEFKERDLVSPRRVSDRLGVPMGDLARIAHTSPDTLMQQPDAPAVQNGLEPIVRILTAVEALTGDADRALTWFRDQPIAGHGGRTALDLVEAGHPDAVLAYLEDLRNGSYP